MDQKSCFKAIIAAGLTPVVLPNVINGDEVGTDVEALAAALAATGPDAVLAVLTTVSVFAPRVRTAGPRRCLAPMRCAAGP